MKTEKQLQSDYPSFEKTPEEFEKFLEENPVGQDLVKSIESLSKE
jgi:hypothetical protein